MSIGRNDSCPCGSGKKYKKCHGALDHVAVVTPEIARATALKAIDVQLNDRIMRFARMFYGPDWLSNVLRSEDLLDEEGPSDASVPIFTPWLQYFKVNAGGLTVAEEWCFQEGTRISPDERLLLNAYRSAWMSIWEVTEVQPGIGSRLRDVLTRQECFIHDIRSSFTLRKFDALLAIILTCNGVSFFGGAHAQPLPPRFTEVVTHEARRWCRVRTRPVSFKKLRDPDMQLALLSLWNDVADDMLHQPMPVMQNTDGDPFVVTTDDFALIARSEEIARTLASVPGVQEPERDGATRVFVVTKHGNSTHPSWDNTIIGRLVLSDTRLTVETNSTRRADALRSVLETQLQGLVRFRMRKEENTAHLMAEAQASVASGEPRVETPLPAEAEAELRKFRERHMRNWIDDSIPALGGHTPREAARLSRVRPKLEMLLKELDRGEAALPEGQRIDLRWLREALGLP